VLGELVSSIGNYIGLKDVIGPLVGGLLGAGAAFYTVRANTKIARETIKEKAEDAAQARHDRAETATIDSFVKREVAQAENLTERFKTLMDGYEARITDLTAEVQTLRQAVSKVQDTLDSHRKACAGCPYFRTRETDAPV
jgi:hypothetical protein